MPKNICCYEKSDDVKNIRDWNSWNKLEEKFSIRSILVHMPVWQETTTQDKYCISWFIYNVNLFFYFEKLLTFFPLSVCALPFLNLCSSVCMLWDLLQHILYKKMLCTAYEIFYDKDTQINLNTFQWMNGYSLMYISIRIIF